MTNQTSIRIEINAVPYQEKNPKIRIYHNSNQLDDIECSGEVTLEYQIDASIDNVLTVELYGKSFGDNNVWDSDSNGSGIEVVVKDIALDDVSIGHLMSTVEFVTNWTDHQRLNETDDFKNKYSRFFSHGVLTFNGRLMFSFSTPVYEFLIDKKYKIPYDSTVARYSNTTELFHYESGLSIVNDIKKIIADHA